MSGFGDLPASPRAPYGASMFDRAPLSVVIPTLEAASGLPATLAALAPAAISGLIREVIVVDGGSRDETRVIAEASGAAVISTAPGRGGQLRAGAAAARGGWLLFLHADTVLETGWQDEAAAFIKDDAGRAAVFTLAFDAKGLAPVLVAAGAMIRTGIFRSPYGDQGLMLPRRLYVEAGGFREIPLMEDVDFIDRLNRKGGFKVLKAIATTSAQRYQRDGYARRVLLNSLCLAMFRLGVAPEKIRSLYR